jgi:hypothetical protein
MFLELDSYFATSKMMYVFVEHLRTSLFAKGEVCLRDRNTLISFSPEGVKVIFACPFGYLSKTQFEKVKAIKRCPNVTVLQASPSLSEEKKLIILDVSRPVITPPKPPKTFHKAYDGGYRIVARIPDQYRSFVEAKRKGKKARLNISEII